MLSTGRTAGAFRSTRRCASCAATRLAVRSGGRRSAGRGRHLERSVEARRSPIRNAPAEPRLSTIASLRGLLDVTRLVAPRRVAVERPRCDRPDRLGVTRPRNRGRQPAPARHRRLRRRHGARERRGARRPPQHRERLGGVGAAPRRALPSSRGVPHPCGRIRLDAELEGHRVVVGAARGEDPWLWHPEDELFVPFYGSDGTLLGIFSVGEPRSGRRPSDEELDVLVAAASQAAVLTEAAQSAANWARSQTALTELLAVSSRLLESGSVDDVLSVVCSAIESALGFDKVVIQLRAPRQRATTRRSPESGGRRATRRSRRRRRPPTSTACSTRSSRSKGATSCRTRREPRAARRPRSATARS